MSSSSDFIVTAGWLRVRERGEDEVTRPSRAAVYENNRVFKNTRAQRVTETITNSLIITNWFKGQVHDQIERLKAFSSIATAVVNG